MDGTNEQGVCTREFCQRCHRVSPVGFFSPHDIWESVAGRHWSNSILCVVCFAALGDEKHIAWEEGIEFFPMSYATHYARKARRPVSLSLRGEIPT